MKLAKSRTEFDGRTAIRLTPRRPHVTFRAPPAAPKRPRIRYPHILKFTSRALIVEMASLRIVVAALCAAWADSACREPHPALPYYHPARESPKLAVLGMYYHDLPASHVPTADQFKTMLHGPAIEAAFEPVCKSNLQPDFNVCVFKRL